MMATFVLSLVFAVAGVILTGCAGVASTYGQGRWWLASAVACFGLAAWGTWEIARKMLA